MQSRPYHHGNLRDAILSTSLRLARKSGMTAVVAREVAREVGVTPAAIYRHFADIEHLRADVAQLARERLAEQMIVQITAAAPAATSKKRAIARFKASGAAYVKFAIKEPGWFDAAFSVTSIQPAREDEPSAWDVLNLCLDDLVTTGAMPRSSRSSAALVSWTSVHGLGSLAALGAMPPNVTIEDLISQVLKAIDKALEIG